MGQHTKHVMENTHNKIQTLLRHYAGQNGPRGKNVAQWIEHFPA
jgi:hypothetical protein